MFDLDGTLADDRHRRAIALKARDCKVPELTDGLWDDYYRLAPLDGVNKLILDMVEHYLAENKREVWIITARRCKFERDTVTWLAQHLSRMPHLLAMRPEGNKARSGPLKRQYMEAKSPLGFHLIIDNHASVIEHLSHLGETLLFNNRIES
jgi:hypothetical protein